MSTRLLLASLLLSTLALADEPLPSWTKHASRLEKPDGAPRAFVATGRSGDFGPADFKSGQAEEEAVQRLGALVADWQEAALRCARKESQARQVSAKSGSRGLLVDFEITQEIDVSLYRVRVTDRAYEGRYILVLMKHELAPLVAGVVADESRPAALREAVRICGEKAFDELVAKY